MAKTWKRPDCCPPFLFYRWFMKKELLNRMPMLAAAVVGILLTGCASADRGYTDINGPSSAVSFTTVTDPAQIAKWTGDRYLMLSLRSIDTYYFQVPDTGYYPGGQVGSVGAPGLYTTGTASGNAEGDLTGPYQSATGGYKIIQYRPGMPY
jgi:hypothetical protein